MLISPLLTIHIILMSQGTDAAVNCVDELFVLFVSSWKKINVPEMVHI